MLRTPLCALALGLALLTPPATASAAECTLRQLASLDMTVEPDGMISIPVKANDREVRMYVGTGHAFSAIIPALADQFGLSRRRIESVRVAAGNGTPITDYVVLPSLQIGGMRGKNLDFMVTLPHQEQGDVAGVIGLDIISQFDAEFDFSAGLFKLFEHYRCERAPVYWTKENFAAIPIRTKRDEINDIQLDIVLDGQAMRASINTVAHQSFLSLRGARRLFGWKSDPAELQPGTSPGSYRYPFKTLTLEGVEIRNPDIDLNGDLSRDWPDRRLYLGLSVLRQTHLYFAFGQKKLYLTAASAR